MKRFAILLLWLASTSPALSQCINGVCRTPTATPGCTDCGLTTTGNALGLGATSAPTSPPIDPRSVPLAPGERIVSIGGVPVGQPTYQTNAGFQQSSWGPQTVAGVHPAQLVAQQKAQYMAARRMSGHPLMHLNRQIPGFAFEGTGWTSGGGQAPTCVPRRGGLVLRGDATVQNGNRKYRVRIWTNS